MSDRPTFGVERHGVSRNEFVDPAVAADCLEALKDYGVIVYRDAHIDDADLVSFSRLLGEVVVAPIGGLPEHPEVSPVTLDPTRSKLATYRRSTFFWHIDGAQDHVPQKMTLLVSREVADEGGDTEFASTYLAYEALPDHDKAEFAKVRVVHSMAATQLLVTPNPTPKERAGWDKVPTREHPLVWTRPDGRRSLLIGATAEKVIGCAPDEGKALLDRLLEWSTRPQFVFRHQWRPGDLVMWDNTGLMHRALPYDPTSRRLLHRTTLAGDLAVA